MLSLAPFIIIKFQVQKYIVMQFIYVHVRTYGTTQCEDIIFCGKSEHQYFCQPCSQAFGRLWLFAVQRAWEQGYASANAMLHSSTVSSSLILELQSYTIKAIKFILTIYYVHNQHVHYACDLIYLTLYKSVPCKHNLNVINVPGIFRKQFIHYQTASIPFWLERSALSSIVLQS